MDRTDPNLRTKDFYRTLPKVDLHRHLEGSLRLSTLLEVGHSHGLNLPNTGRLRELVQIGEEEPFTIENFLSKFETLRLFYRSPEIIARLTREAVADAAADKVRYLELRFTPAALGRAEHFPLSEVMDWVIEGAEKAEQEFGVTTRLIASVNRHEGPDLAAQVVKVAADRAGKGIIGLDLAGNEAAFSALAFAGVFREAREAGLHITAHAGEWVGAQNVVEAITQLKAERIGHGVRVLEDPAATALARERQIAFEVCITSNYQSGVVAALSVHPLPRMLSLGLNATINSDDPSISQIRLSDEYRVACEDLGLSLAVLQARVLAAAQAAFIPETQRQRLVESLTQEFNQK
ncbi:MAG TPA: adenosine deaminase [Anaerolineales bacterium]